MRDPSHPLELVGGRETAGVRRGLTPRGPDHDGLIDLASNDYLGLCGDERISLTDGDFMVATRALAAVRDHDES
jgi:hypothetical protein